MVEQDLNKREARRIVRWFQKNLNIEDWTVKLWISDDPPRWADSDTTDTAQTATYNQYKKALVWVSPGRCLDCSDYAEPSVPGAVLMHEMLHVLAADVGWEADDSCRANEQVWNVLGVTLYRAYLNDRKK